MDDEWIKRFQSGISNVREREENRTSLFKKRADALWNSCFAIMQRLISDANATLRSSSLTLKVTRSEYSPFSAWAQVDMCNLAEDGSAGEVKHSLRISTTLNAVASYEPETYAFAKLDLDSVREDLIREMLYGFAIAAVRAHYENPKNEDVSDEVGRHESLIIAEL